MPKKKSKRSKLERDCERFDIPKQCLLHYKSKLQAHKNPKLNHLARKVFADYLLLTKSDKKGICTCVTCGNKNYRHSPQMHPWHYRTAGSSLKYRYVELNVRPQCNRCNVMLNGNYRNYHIFMLNEVWTDVERQLRNDKELHTIKNYEYAEMIIKRWNYTSNDNRFIAYASQ